MKSRRTPKKYLLTMLVTMLNLRRQMQDLVRIQRKCFRQKNYQIWSISKVPPLLNLSRIDMKIRNSKRKVKESKSSMPLLNLPDMQKIVEFRPQKFQGCQIKRKPYQLYLQHQNG